MIFGFNNTNKTTEITNEQVSKILFEVSTNFECIDDCKCKEILGFDCDDNDNHCPVKEILFNLSIEGK